MKFKIFWRRQFEKFAAPWVGIGKCIAIFFKRKEIQNDLLTLAYFAITPLVLGALLLTWLNFSTWKGFLFSLLNPFLIPLALLFVISATRFLTCCGALIAVSAYHKRLKEGLNDYIIIKQGCPGSGKSATGFYEAVYKARLVWEELQYKYWLYKCKIAAGKRFSEEDWKKYQEICQAIQFYETNPQAVPCLMTNTGCTVGKQKSLMLTSKMLQQKEIIPAYTVIFLDETGDTLDNHGFNSEPARLVNEIFKYARHYGEFRIICAEQEGSNMLIGSRRPASYIETQHEQKPFLKPRFLMLIYDFVKFFLWLNFYKQINPKTAVFMLFLEGLIDCIGFRRIKQSVSGNKEREGEISVKTKSRITILESALNCHYSDRAYMLGYTCIGDIVKCQSWDSELVTRNELDARRRLRSSLLLSVSKTQAKKNGKK